MTESADLRPPLDRDRLAGQISNSRISFAVDVLPEATSTNAVLAARATQGAPEGSVVVAEHQTSGRGRLDRSWEAPAHAALTFSVLIRPNVAPEVWPWLPLLTGYAVHAALVDRVPDLGLKWPNDLLVSDHKVAGILVERVDTPTGPAAVLGIGVNVSQSQDELPVPEATSLTLHAEGNPDRTEVLGQILTSLDALLPLLDDPVSLRRAYSGECVTLGKEVRVDVPSGEPLSGTAVDIDEGGRLVVRTAGGEVAVGAGDVIHVRATNL